MENTQSTTRDKLPIDPDILATLLIDTLENPNAQAAAKEAARKQLKEIIREVARLEALWE